jgi:hypothetical protein
MFAGLLAPPALLNHFHLTGVAPADGTGVNGKHIQINTLRVLSVSAVKMNIKIASFSEVVFD